LLPFRQRKGNYVPAYLELTFDGDGCRVAANNQADFRVMILDGQKHSMIQRRLVQRVRAVFCATSHTPAAVVDNDWTVALEESAP
jgi:hypothetical protein